jgi:triosephosphate isomerase
MPQKIVAGNWKMNLSLTEGLDLVKGIDACERDQNVRTIVFPPALFVHTIGARASGEIEVGVQNFYPESEGAFTGELSIKQLKSVGATIGLIGHSERRAYFGESNAFLKEKVDAAVNNDFEFIFCCGEPLFIREKNGELDFVKNQLDESLFHLTAEQIQGKIIAYEPVWAIGTGRTATSEQAEAMHAAIRLWITEKYTAEIAQQISILYGGSCNASNAKELFACPNVDGGLIGGAALVASSFLEIVDAFE